MDRAINWFKGLDKNKKIIIGLFIVMSILAMLTGIMKGWLGQEEKWDYKKINSAKDLISRGEVSYERRIYWQVDGILKQYIYSYMYDQDTETKEIAKMPYKDYYKALTTEYSKYLGVSEYNNKAKLFLEELVIESDSPRGMYSPLPYKIVKVYKYSGDRYLCEIQVTYLDENNIEKQRTKYLGIKLFEKESKFNICYVE